MSDRLGDDVLLLILEHLSPPFLKDWAYPYRQKTLRSVCLASRRFLMLAQPLLGRYLQVDDRKSFDRVRGGVMSEAARSCTRIYVVYPSDMDSDLASVAVAFAEQLPKLQNLRVEGQRLSNLSGLAGHLGLRRLELHRVELLDSVPPVLPHLERLKLSQVRASTEHFEEMLRPSKLPSLRFLAVHDVRGPKPADFGDPDEPTLLVDILQQPILDQLDVIHTLPDQLDLDGPLARGVNPPVLVYTSEATAKSSAPALPFSRHIAEAPRLVEVAHIIEELLSRLATAIEQAPTPEPDEPVALVILTRAIRRTAAQSIAVAHAVRALEATCEAHRVRIMWLDERGLSDQRDFGVEAFWRFAREVRAAQREAAR